MTAVISFCFNLFNENSHIIYQPGGDCIIIDPGNYDEEEFKLIRNFINDKRLHPLMIVNTHCHVDHVLGVNSLKNEFGIPFYIHPLEQPVLDAVKLYAGMYGFPDYSEPVPDGFIEEGQFITVGESSWEIIFVPGHSPGHIALYEKSLSQCIVGDILFKNSVGRTDLPGGDQNSLIHGIKTKLFRLPDEVEIFSGHGPNTSIGHERKFNPFCGGQ